MAELEHFHEVANCVARLWASAMPIGVHYKEIRKLGPELEQLYVDSKTFCVHECRPEDHCRALFDKVPLMIEALREELVNRGTEKFYSLALPEGASDARSVGPVRMVSIFHEGDGEWLTRFDVIFEKAING